jgi:hypothetical protein
MRYPYLAWCKLPARLSPNDVDELSGDIHFAANRSASRELSAMIVSPGLALPSAKRSSTVIVGGLAPGQTAVSRSLARTGIGH